MLPTYKDTSPKGDVLAAVRLSKAEAAEYLAIAPGDVLTLVRQEHLVPTVRGDALTFSIEELDRTALWYDKYRHQRRTVAWWHLGIGAVVITISCFAIYHYSLAGNRVPWLGAHFAFAVGAGLWGLALRSHMLEREMLSSPLPDYKIAYPAIVLVNAAAIVAAWGTLAGTTDAAIFFAVTFPAAFVLALYAHPKTWIIPRWLAK